VPNLRALSDAARLVDIGTLMDEDAIKPRVH
jgi:hypothetical protein